MEIHKVQINELISPEYNPRTITSENEKAVQDNRNRFTLIISAITIFFTALTFIFNFLLH